MEIETNTIEDCITIPLGGSKEVIQIFFDELEDDPSKLISVLIDESASLECWIQAAVGYYRMKKYDQFIRIINRSQENDCAIYFAKQITERLIMMNYKVAYLLKMNMLTSGEYQRYDNESSMLINHEDIDPGARACALSLKCIYCLRNDNLKRAYTYLQEAREGKSNYLMTFIAAAMYFTQAGDYAKAIETYRLTMCSYPTCPASVRVGLAYCFYKNGNYKKAIQALDRALQLDPACEEALAMKASLVRSEPNRPLRDRIVSSLQIASQLYAVNPNHPVALNYIADHYFWEWVTIPDLAVRVNYGSTTVKVEGDCSGVLHPGQPVRINGVVCRICHQKDAVEEHSILLSAPYTGEDVVEPSPIQIHNTEKALEIAKHIAKEVKSKSIQSEAWEIAARCHHLNNDWGNASKLYTLAINANKRNTLAQYGMAQITIHLSSASKTKLEKENLRNQARSYLRNYVQFGGQNHDVSFLVSYLQYKNNDWAKALATAISLPDRADQIASTTFLNSQLLKAQLYQGNFQSPEDLQKARRLYEACIHLASPTSALVTSPLLWSNIAILRVSLHDIKDALVAAEESMRLCCSKTSIELQNDQPFYSLPEETISSLLNETINVTLIYNYAVILDEAGKEEEARRVLELVKNSVPQYCECELRLIKQLLRRKEYDQGIARLQAMCADLKARLQEKSLKESQTLYSYFNNCYIDVRCLLAQTLALQQKGLEAINVITESPVHPRDLYLDIVQTNIYLQLSRSQDPRGYLDLASNMLQSALKKNPRNVYLANGCGIVLYRTGKIQQAINVFKKVRENSLSFISACVNLAHLHLIEKRYYDASGLYQTILQQEGMKTDIQLHLCLALAQMRCGQHVQAQETLMRVQKLDPTNTQIRYNMALCNISYAETLFKKVSYFHSKTFDSQTLRYPCCGGDQASQGCQKHSRRKQGEINQAEHALQQAATQLAEIKNEKPKDVELTRVDEQLVKCKNLWDQLEEHRSLDQAILDFQEKMNRTSKEKQERLERHLQAELQAEREKREHAQRVKMIVEEEQKKLEATMTALAEKEADSKAAKGRRGSRKSGPRAVTGGGGAGGRRGAGAGGRGRGRRTRNLLEDEIIEDDDDDDTDDNGEMNEWNTSRNIFGDEDDNEDDNEEEKEEKNDETNTSKSAKRKRLVVSSEDDDDDDDDDDKKEMDDKRVRLDDEKEKEVEALFDESDSEEEVKEVKEVKMKKEEEEVKMEVEVEADEISNEVNAMFEDDDSEEEEEEMKVEVDGISNEVNAMFEDNDDNESRE